MSAQSNYGVITDTTIRKEKIEQLMKHRFFFTQVEYPVQNGFLEYGPVMTVVKNEIINSWKKIVVDENMLEIDTSSIVPYEVLKNSGHIDKFCDIVLTDGITIVRADHFIEERIGEYHLVPNEITEDTLKKVDTIKEQIFNNDQNILNIKEHNICIKNCKKTSQFDKSIVNAICNLFPCKKKHINDCNKKDIDFIVKVNNLRSDIRDFFPAKDFQLIFKLNDHQYMRPELAQGIFINFKKGYDFNNGQMPFAIYSIGKSYRNEISARGGMLRTKEFYQAEIEYFTEDKTHKDFCNIADIELVLLPNSSESSFTLSLRAALNQNIISSEAMCVFLARGYLFLIDIGIYPQTIRCRQHRCNEMAHYAHDCWDIEILTITGWVECIGIADRSNYDLTVHAKNINSYVKKKIQPIRTKKLEIIKKHIIKDLKEEKYIEFEQYVQSIPVDNYKNKVNYDVTFNGKVYNLRVIDKIIEHVEYIPTVIEPSFGISRILYALIEQNLLFYTNRTVLALKPKLCFKHVSITTLINNTITDKYLNKLENDAIKSNIRYQINRRNVSIGKKYFSSDEIGIPFFITVDSETNINQTVTIRDRNTMSQIRVQIEDAINIVVNLINETTKWNNLIIDNNN